MPSEGAEPIAIGFDVIVVGDDGKIHGVYGFIDKIPAVAWMDIFVTLVVSSAR